jgi:hypothetical protein
MNASDLAEYEAHRNAPSHSDLPHRFYEDRGLAMVYWTTRSLGKSINFGRDISWLRGAYDYTLLEAPR